MVRRCESGKRKRRDSRKKREDIISQLPDEILISIISGLTVQEAAATSLLSTRWRYLSPYITCLRFPPFSLKYGSREQLEEIQTRRRLYPYIDSIDCVLDWHKGGRIKEFRVHTLSWIENNNIGKWFEFALAKEVEIIDIFIKLDIRCSTGHCLHQWENYNLVGEGQTLKCLKQLSLSGIDVDGGEIQLLLSKFPLLESLSIASSRTLKHASIVGHSTSKLKHLDISRCGYNGSIEISNLVNLISLGCNHMGFSLTLNNVPNLIEFSMHGVGWRSDACVLSGMPSSIHDQLRTLKISSCRFPSLHAKDSSSMLPQLIGLKNLELALGLESGEIASSFQPLHLCQACPSLEKLEIKFKCCGSASQIVKVKGDESSSSLEWMLCKFEKKLCPNLKKMKISGFIGSPMELEFAFSILTIVGDLEELVVEVCDQNRTINQIKTIRRIATDRAWLHFRNTAFKVLVV